MMLRDREQPHLYGAERPKVVPGSIWAPLAQHYAITRLISDVLGLPLIGFGQLEPILGIWNTAVPARGTSWGLVKTTYR